MSVYVQSQVWRADLESTRKMVLLKLADHADDEGGNVWPSVRRLAAACSMSDRTVQRHLRALEEAGLIAVEAFSTGGRGRARHYRIDLDAVARAGADWEKRVTDCHPLDAAGESKRVTPVTRKGDNGDTKRVTLVSPQPSIEPSRNTNSARVREEGPAKAVAKAAENGAAVAQRCLELSGLADSPAPVHGGPVRQWLADGADPELDIYPAIERLAASRRGGGMGPPRSLAYFSAAVADARNARLARARAAETPDRWRKRVRRWRADGTWFDEWGPPPGSPGSRAPPDIAKG